MKRILICFAVCGVILLGAVGPSYARDDMQARIEAATAYEKVVPVETMINDTLDALKANPQLRTVLSDDDFDAMRAAYNMPELRQKLIEVMAKHFTVEELRAMEVFYSTPEGRSIMKKIPQYMSDFMPYIQQQSMKIMQESIERKRKKAQ